MERSVDAVPEEPCPALGFPDSPLKGEVSIFNELSTKSISCGLEREIHNHMYLGFREIHKKINFSVNHKHCHFFCRLENHCLQIKGMKKLLSLYPSYASVINLKNATALKGGKK